MQLCDVGGDATTATQATPNSAAIVSSAGLIVQIALRQLAQRLQATRSQRA
jgi:hypothetical protein